MDEDNQNIKEILDTMEDSHTRITDLDQTQPYYLMYLFYSLLFSHNDVFNVYIQRKKVNWGEVSDLTYDTLIVDMTTKYTNMTKQNK